MIRGKSLVCCFAALAFCVGALGDTKAPQSKLTAAEIVEKNVAARGGLQAWRAVTALAYAGEMEAGGNSRPSLPVPELKRGTELPPSRPTEQVKLPFVMDLQRSHKARVEIQFNGKTAIQVFDGATGWKLRPFLNRMEVEPYTAEEMKAASTQEELDGPLVDYAAKGTKLEFDGMEKVEGHDTYKIKLTMKNGNSIHVWIDVETFLEAKMEGTPRRLDGQYHPVEIFLRDYRATDGLMIPYVVETHVLPIKGVAGFRETTEKVAIDRVTVNPKFADSLFAKPQIMVGTNSKQAPAAGGHSLP